MKTFVFVLVIAAMALSVAPAAVRAECDSTGSDCGDFTPIMPQPERVKWGKLNSEVAPVVPPSAEAPELAYPTVVYDFPAQSGKFICE